MLFSSRSELGYQRTQLEEFVVARRACRGVLLGAGVEVQSAKKMAEARPVVVYNGSVEREMGRARERG